MKKAVLGALLILLGLTGCDLLSSSSSEGGLDLYLTTEQQTGSLPSLSVADAGQDLGLAHDSAGHGRRWGHFPYDSIASATIVVQEVKVYGRQQRGTSVFTGSQQIELLNIKSELGALLAQATIEPDTIRALELRVEQGQIQLKNGRTFTLRVPVTEGRVLVLFHPPLVVQEGQTIQITLEFNLSRSFVAIPDPSTGGIREFLFKPVIRPVRVKTVEGVGHFGRGRMGGHGG
jgi:hypothetical protein